MAEAWLNHLAGDFFEAHSAGLEPGTLNPLAVEVMREAGIDISHKQPQGIFDVYRSGKAFGYVIRVCADNHPEGRGPIFPSSAERFDWHFPDPSQLTGTREEKLQAIRQLRDDIRATVENWCAEMLGQVAA